MGFYDLTQEERTLRVQEINQEIFKDLSDGKNDSVVLHASDEDTYIRKTAYQAVGKIFNANRDLRSIVLQILQGLLNSDNEKIRQTVINAAGEIGKFRFEEVQGFFDIGLFDEHHSVRNAVIGSIKKMGNANPTPVFKWTKQYLQHPDKEIRREICHGIELRGRKYPQDILPMLKTLQFDETKRVRNTLIHVIGQISYKKGCLKTVLEHLKTWENNVLVMEAIEEIIDVHHRYRSFAILTQQEAIALIDANYR